MYFYKKYLICFVSLCSALVVSCKSIRPDGDTRAASRLHGAHDDRYLLRLVSQEGKPGIYAFETCLHDQGVARQGTCVSAFRNLKDQPVPISIEVIAHDQLSGREAEILAAVKREHRQYTTALAARSQQVRMAGIITLGSGGASLMLGGMGTYFHNYELWKEVEKVKRRASEDAHGLSGLWYENEHKLTDKLNKSSEAFERFIISSKLDLKNEAARLSEFLGEYRDKDKILALKNQGSKKLKMYEVYANAYDRYTSINQLLDDVAKGMVTDSEIAEIMAARHYSPEGKHLLETIRDVQAEQISLKNQLDDIYQNTGQGYWRNYKPRKFKEGNIVAQKGLLGFIDELPRLEARGRVGFVAAVIGFGAFGAASAIGMAEMSLGDSAGTDDHEVDWHALLESGQADLITDFSSSLWLVDGAEAHATVPSVQELMDHITLFQRELWFGGTSDAPDVVQIVKHCWPRKSRGGEIKPKCESVSGV